MFVLGRWNLSGLTFCTSRLRGYSFVKPLRRSGRAHVRNGICTRFASEAAGSDWISVCGLHLFTDDSRRFMESHAWTRALSGDEWVALSRETPIPRPQPRSQSGRCVRLLVLVKAPFRKSTPSEVISGWQWSQRYCQNVVSRCHQGDGMRALVKLWRKCLDRNGDYFEK